MNHPIRPTPPLGFDHGEAVGDALAAALMAIEAALEHHGREETEARHWETAILHLRNAVYHCHARAAEALKARNDRLTAEGCRLCADCMQLAPADQLEEAAYGFGGEGSPAHRIYYRHRGGRCPLKIHVTEEAE